MSFLTCFTIVVLGCIFSQHNVEAQVVSPSAALDVYPYFSPMGYRRPSYLSDATNEQLLALSGQCNMRIDYMYQLYEILNSYTALTIEQDISILNRMCGMVDRRRLRYGLSPRGNYGNYFIPNAPALNMMTRREPQVISGLMQDIRSNFNGAMRNLSDTMNYYMPNFTYGLEQEWNDIMGYEIPSTVANDVSDLSGRMTRTLGNMISDLW